MGENIYNPYITKGLGFSTEEYLQTNKKNISNTINETEYERQFTKEGICMVNKLRITCSNLLVTVIGEK